MAEGVWQRDRRDDAFGWDAAGKVVLPGLAIPMICMRCGRACKVVRMSLLPLLLGAVMGKPDAAGQVRARGSNRLLGRRREGGGCQACAAGAAPLAPLASPAAAQRCSQAATLPGHPDGRWRAATACGVRSGCCLQGGRVWGSGVRPGSQFRFMPGTSINTGASRWRTKQKNLSTPAGQAELCWWPVAKGQRIWAGAVLKPRAGSCMRSPRAQARCRYRAAVMASNMPLTATAL